MNSLIENDALFSFNRSLIPWNRLSAGALVLTIALICSVSGSATAADDYGRPGLYVGLSGVFQTNPLEGEIEDLLDDAAADNFGSSVDLTIEDSGGFSALVGYRVASFFATELQYEFIDEYDIRASVDGPFVSGSGSIYSLTGHTLTANAKFIAPIWRVQPYFLVGVGFSSFDVDRGRLAGVIEALDEDINIDNGTQTSFAGRLGLGVDLYLTNNLVLNAQGQLVVTTIEEPGLDDIDDLNYTGFSAGLQYRF